MARRRHRLFRRPGIRLDIVGFQEVQIRSTRTPNGIQNAVGLIEGGGKATTRRDVPDDVVRKAVQSILD